MSICESCHRLCFVLYIVLYTFSIPSISTYNSFLQSYIDRELIFPEEKSFIVANFVLRCKGSCNSVQCSNELEKLSKDKLYEMFQKILSINKNEALTIYNVANVSVPEPPLLSNILFFRRRMSREHSRGGFEEPKPPQLF